MSDDEQSPVQEPLHDQKGDDDDDDDADDAGGGDDDDDGGGGGDDVFPQPRGEVK